MPWWTEEWKHSSAGRSRARLGRPRKRERNRNIRTRLNLATAPLESLRRFYVIAAAIGIPALVLCFALSVKVVRDRAATGQRRLEAQRLEREIAELRNKRTQLEQFFADSSTRLLTQRAAFLNAIIDQRSFPWTDFFVDLEKRLPAGVHVISLAPDLEGEHVAVKLRVGALSDKSKLDFLKALEGAPEFSHLELLSESRSGKNEDRDVAVLDLTAEYRPVPESSVKKTAERRGQE